MEFPLPNNEEERLQVLHSFHILDTLADENYDRIVALAANIFDMPISLISLIDWDREWFKSKIGLDDPELPREYAFCTHTILEDRVMVVEDATLDARFSNNPLVTTPPNFIFYAGAPIIVKDVAIGAVCVIDHQPRQFSEINRRILDNLAKQVANLLTIRKTTQELRAKQHNLEKLESLLPMCAWCKRIKNDTSYWIKVEDYIANLSQCDVTHSICPDCETQLEIQSKLAKKQHEYSSDML